MGVFRATSTVFVSSLLVFGGTAIAKDALPKASSKAAEVELTHDSVPQRLSSSSLAKARPPRIGSLAVKKRVIENQESAVSSLPSRRAPKAAVSTAQNPYELALAGLRIKAAKVAPSVTGRAKVSFQVGRTGKAIQPMVFGLTPELSSALSLELARYTFPKKDAGLFYSTRLTIKAAQVPAKKGKRASLAKRTRKTRRR